MSGIASRWEHFPHGVDIGVRGIGATKESAFAQAALALTAVVTDPTAVVAEQMVPITCEAPDEELVLVDWLNALMYEMATRRMLFSRFVVLLRGSALTAEAWGEPIDIVKHQPTVEVKGAPRAFGPGHPDIPQALRGVGQPVLIGGTMGTASYILVGTREGMHHAFGSACHGAGRSMSRHEALRHWKGRDVIEHLAGVGLWYEAALCAAWPRKPRRHTRM